MYEGLFENGISSEFNIDNIELNTNVSEEESLMLSNDIQRLESEYVTSVNRIDYISKMWGDVNSAIDGTHAVVQSGKITTKTELALLQGAMDSTLKDVKLLSGASENDDVALESFSPESREAIGIEVFKRAKDSIVRLIQWFVEQYKALVKNIKEFFKKHFSLLGKTQKIIDKQKEKLTEYTKADYEIKDGEIDVSGWANALQVNNKIVNLQGLTTGLNQYGSIAEIYQRSVFGGLNKCISDFESNFKKVKVDESEIDLSTLFSTTLDKHRITIDSAFGKLLKTTVDKSDPRFKTVTAFKHSKEGLLGNYNLFRTKSDKTPETMSEKARAILQNDILLRNNSYKQGDAKNDGKVSTLTLTECGEVLNAADGALNSIAGLSQNKEAESAIANLDKAFESFNKLKSDIKSDDFTAELRQYLTMIGNQLTAFRKQVMDTPRSLSMTGAASINAATRWTGKSISNHKKA